MVLRRASSARLWLLWLTFLVGVTNATTDGPQVESRCDFTDGICESWTSSKCSTYEGCFKAVQARNTTDGPIRDHTKGTDPSQLPWLFDLTEAIASGSAGHGETSQSVSQSVAHEAMQNPQTKGGSRGNGKGAGEDGWYGAAVFPSGKWTVLKPAVIQRNTTGPFCFMGWYHVSGLQSPVLTFAATALTRRGASYSTEDMVFLRANFSQTRLWQKVVYQEDRNGTVTIFISSSSALNSVVGLDDLSIVPGKCPPANHDGSCTFDYEDQCGYTSSSPKGSWYLKKRYSILQTGMVPDDHTTGTPLGGYMYHRVDANKTTSAVLTSPTLAKPAKPTRCLRFFYYAVKGSSGLEVSVEFQSGASGLSNNFRNLRNVSKPVWNRYRTSLVPNRWYPAEASFSAEEKHWLNFRCFLDTPIKNPFFCAIDDVEVSDCSVEGEQFGCDFDNGSMCGWESRSDPGHIPWTLSDLAGGRPLALRKDRTTGSPLGGFVYAENKALEVAKARLSSPALDSSWNGVACLSFWHFTVVNGITTSVTLTVTSASGDIFWSSNGELKKSWSHQVVLLQLQDLKDGPPERVFLDASLNTSLVAVDDLVLSLGHCPSYQNGLSCDFERGPCTWTSTLRTRNLATWRIQSGSVRTSLAHPHVDHTHNSTMGSYMFLSALARAYGQRAELVSEVVSFGVPGSLCMDFWFNVGGSGHSQLQVLTAVDSTGFNAVWSFKDDTDGHWLHGQMKVAQGHRIMFQGSIQDSEDGFMALDDIAVYVNESCSNLPRDNAARNRVLGLLSCSLKPDGQCTWENWTSAEGARWRFGRDVSPEIPLLPPGPPGGPKGDYFYMDCSFLGSANDTVVALELRSPTLPTLSEPVCLSFHYYMFGAGPRRLVLKHLSESSNSTMFQQTGCTTADRWYRVTRTLNLKSARNKFVFRVDSTKCVSGHIALAEFVAVPGTCEGTDDGRGVCGFEDSLCDWKLDGSWERKRLDPESRMSRALKRSGPVTSAWAMVLPRKEGSSVSGNLTSPSFVDKQRPRCLELWHYGDVTKDSSLWAGITLKSGPAEILWTRPGSVSAASWALARVEVPEQKSDFQVFISGNINATSDSTTVVAVDNVRLTLEPCPHVASCDFEEDLCGYENDFMPPFKWLVGSGRMSGSASPKIPGLVPLGGDSTVPRWFAYVDMSKPIEGPNLTATLRSAIFRADDNSTVLLRFLRTGKAIQSMEVRLNAWHPNGSKTVKSWTLGEGEDWQSFEQDLQPSDEAQLEVSVTRSGQTGGIAALARIAIGHVTRRDVPVTAAPAKPAVGLSCNFESGNLCSWKPDETTSGQPSWVLNDPAERIPASLHYDHTTGGYAGRFIYAESKGGTKVVAKLKSAVLPKSLLVNGCLNFWYFKLTTNSSSSNSLVASFSTEKGAIWTDKGHQPLTWTEGWARFAKFQPGDNVQIVLEASVVSGFIALDDIYLAPGVCPQSPKCTFENNDDHWRKNAMGNIRDWNVLGADKLGVPDHTMGSTKGHFLYLNTTNVPQRQHPFARVFFGRRTATRATCLKFWWRSHGAVSRLNVYRFTEATGLRDPILSVMTEQNSQWWHGRSVTFSAHSIWQVVFEVLPPQQFHTPSGVLLDDIEYVNGECPREDYCTFEHPDCLHWVDAYGSAADATGKRAFNSRWQLERGDISLMIRDHTLDSIQGHFLFFSEKEAGRTAGLVLTDSRYRCASFWYQLSAHPKGCTIKTRDLRLTGSTAGKWKQARFRLALGDDKIIAVSGNNSEAFVLLDDLLVSEKSCTNEDRQRAQLGCKDGKLLPMEKLCNFIKDCDGGEDEVNCGPCNFEKDSCGWTAIGSGFSEFKYSWKRVDSKLEAVGPGNDHTTGDGSYLLLRASQESRFASVSADARSPNFRDTAPLCVMKFWYNYFTMNHTYNFEAIMRVDNFFVSLWELSLLGERQPEGTWNQGQILIGRYRTDLMITFRVEESPTLRGYTAIDDVTFEDCAMPTPSVKLEPGKFLCRNNVSIDTNYRCDYVDHCGDYSDEENCDDFKFRCNFDSSFCDWMPGAPAGNVGHGWERASPSGSLKEKPTRDHTTGNKEGQFLYLGSNTRTTSASILGPKLLNSSECRMRFHYIIRGPAVAVLTVNARSTSDGAFKEIWRSDRPSEFFHFTEASVTFQEDQPFQVSFGGTVEGARDLPGYVAIDDVSFTPTCSPFHDDLPPTPKVTTVAPKTCPKDNFACASLGGCIPLDQVCDFKNQCSDGSDEAQCGACDFSVGMCGLKNVESQTRLAWQRVSAQMVHNNPDKFPELPRTDSADSPKGFYAAFTLANPSIPHGAPVSLITPRLGATGHACRVSMYIYFTKTRRFEIFVSPGRAIKGAIPYKETVLTAGEDVPLRTWKKLTASIGNRPRGIWFSFQANDNTSIDEITYHDCHPESQSLKSLNCTFEEEDGCGWFPDYADATDDWVVEDTRPGSKLVDHTTGKGKYLILKNYIPGRRARARMVSAGINATGDRGRCLGFWYQLVVSNAGYLSVNTIDANRTVTGVWFKRGSQGDAWVKGEVNIKTKVPVKLMLEGFIQAPWRGPAGYVVVDDITFDEQPCKPSFTCDFEQGPCEWTLEDWIIESASLSKVVPSDHTLERPIGHYARVKLLKGRMLSPRYELVPEERQCLRFWHFTAGLREELLNVSRMALDPAAKEELLWSVHGEDTVDQQWASASVNVAVRKKSLQQLVLGGQTSGKLGSVVAVDDLLLSGWSCPDPGSCNFEDDLCNWRNLGGPLNLTWRRWSGPTQSRREPQFDHTLGTRQGHFLHLDSRYGLNNAVGVLESELLHYSPGSCLQFYYYVDNIALNAALSVDYVVHGKPFLRAWELDRSPRSGWTLFQHYEAQLPTAYNIWITGYPGLLVRVDVAIDDIQVFKGKCPDDSTPTDPPAMERNNTVWDCDFDVDFCSWSQPGKAAWIMRSGKTAILKKEGPHWDSKQSSPQGKYAYFSPVPNTTKTFLASPVLKMSDEDYCVQFWYFLFGLAPVQLKVGLGTIKGGMSQVTWHQQRANSRIWQHGSLTVSTKNQSGAGELSVTVEASREGPGLGEIAIGQMHVAPTGTCPHPLGTLCDFEGDGLCGYDLDTSGGGHWRRVNARTAAAMWHTYDHTFGFFNEGHYLMLQLPGHLRSKPGSSQSASVVIPDQPGRTTKCLGIWFFMEGEGSGTLNVSVRPKGSSGRPSLQGMLWSVAERGWRYQQARIKASGSHEILITGEVDAGGIVSIGLDDLLLSDGDCPRMGKCDFEKDMCGWDNNGGSEANRNWVRNSGSTPSTGTGPLADHTLGTADGTYVYLDGRSVEANETLTGVLVSQPWFAGVPHCLSFWAHMNAETGTDVPSLRIVTVHDKDDRKRIPHLVLQGGQGNSWIYKQMALDPVQDLENFFTIRFVGTTGGARSTDIALDDISVSQGVCENTVKGKYDCKDGEHHIEFSQVCDFKKDCPGHGDDEQLCGQCDFDTDLCGWFSPPDTAEWYRTIGKYSPMNLLLPNEDVSKGTMKGGYVAASGPRNATLLRAVLKSPNGTHALKRSGKDCTMTFWYYMPTAQYAVFQVRKFVTEFKPVIWRTKRDGGKVWHKGAASVGRSRSEFGLSFELVPMMRNPSAVSVDVVDFVDCALPEPDKAPCNDPNSFQCLTKDVCIHKDLICDHTDDCGDGSDELSEVCRNYTGCTFEFGREACDWITVTPGNNRKLVTWQSMSADYSRTNVDTGPYIDHTVGAVGRGQVLVLRARRPEHFSSSAEYKSPNYKTSDGGCLLRFFYYLHGQDVGAIRVFAQRQESTDRTNWEQLWEVKGERGQLWIRAAVPYHSDGPFRFVLEGTLGGGYASDLAIDDISLSPGCVPYYGTLPLPPPPPLPQCRRGQFPCRNGSCIPVEQVCDFEPDCPDGSDEDGCGPCDFEVGTCGWSDAGKGPVVWERQQGKDSVDPSKDHTKGSGEGHFMSPASVTGGMHTEASLVGPPMPPASSRCKMHLWSYYTTKKDTMPLTVRHFVPGNNATLLAQLSPSNEWKLNTIGVPQYNGDDARIEIRLVADFIGYSFVAVDDISFDDCRPSSVLVDCSFDDPGFYGGFCHWNNSQTRLNGWTIRNATAGDGSPGPTADHFGGKTSYAFFRQGNSSADESAWMESPRVASAMSNVSCFSFWYWKSHDNLVSFEVEAETESGNSTRFERAGFVPGGWNYGELPVTFGEPYLFNISASPLTDNLTDAFVAVDDVFLEAGPCRRAGYCDFETDFCTWKPTTEGLTLGWTRQNGQTAAGAAPFVDHTLQSADGYFALAVPKRQGDRARLTSPRYESPGDRCLRFWFNMAGPKAGELSVYQTVNGSARRENLKPVWRRSGDHLGIWREGHAALPRLNNYHIVFEAFTTTSATKDDDEASYVALDDVQLSLDSCENTISCSFEDGLCGWVNYEAESDFLWVSVTGSVGAKFAGPSEDATTSAEQGSYMLAAITNLKRGDKAILVSDEMDVVSFEEYCFVWWYVVTDGGNTGLVLQKMSWGERASSMNVTRIRGAPKWTQMRTSIHVEPGVSSLAFRLVAETYANYSSASKAAIAVDDIEFFRGSCKKGPEGPVPPTAKTYPPHPLDCDFELDDCAWHNGTGDPRLSFWRRTQGDAYRDLHTLMPRTDHTTLSVYGTFILFTVKLIRSQSETTTFESKYPLQTEDRGACVKFWYYRQGTLASRFRLLGRDATTNATTIYWTTTGPKGPQWNYAQVLLGKDQVVYLAFAAEATLGSQTALDDIAVNVGECPPPALCDFEGDECGWRSAVGDPGPFWNRTSALVSVGKRDHTLGAVGGHVLAVNTFGKKATEGSWAEIYSRPYSGEDALCIRFWYQLTEGHKLSVGIYHLEATFPLKVDLVTGKLQQPSTWHGAQANVYFVPKSEFEYYFMADLGARGGVVAVDDIEVRGRCPELGTCDFEDDFCLWENEPVVAESRQWNRVTGRSNVLGPDSDHTSGQLYGTYAVVSAYSYMTAPPSRLMSPLLTRCSGRCFSFWVYHHGTQPHMLDVILRTPSGDASLPYATVADTDGRWVKAQLNFTSKSEQCRIGLKPTFPRLQSVYLAVDDFVVADGPCEPLEDSNHPSFTCDNGTTHLTRDKLCNFMRDCADGSDEVHCGTKCDFERDNCSWWSTQWDSSNRLAWSRRKGSLSSEPAEDHTSLSAGGHFLQLASQPGAFGVSEAKIRSPYLRDASPSCTLKFWYYSTMTDTRSAVKVRIVQSIFRHRETTVLATRGHNGTIRRHEWRLAAARIARVPQRFSVVLLGELGPGDKTFAVDDLSFTSCGFSGYLPPLNCSMFSRFLCANGNCVSRKRLCDFNDDCGDGSDESSSAGCGAFPGRCDFEDGVCDWSVAGTGWRLRRKEGVNNLDFGDDRGDHTTNSVYGNFLWFPFAPRSLGKVASFSSPLVNSSGETKCLFRFYYTYLTTFTHLDYAFYGANSGSLAVYARFDLLGEMKLLWKTSNVFGQHYERKMINLASLTGTFQIVIQAKAGQDRNGAWAVDDVSFTDGCMLSRDASLPTLLPKTTPAPTVNPCADSEFACSDGKCVDLARRCDFIDDCSDGSDEAICATCSFDNGRCGWQDVSIGRYSWVRLRTSPKGFEPTADVSGKGSFMSVEEGDGSESELAVLRSNEHGPSSSACSFEMYYFVFNVTPGNEVLTLSLQRKNEPFKIALLRLYRNTDKKWVKASARIARHDKPGWSLEISSELPTSGARIAIDDISLVNCSDGTAAGKDCTAVGKLPCANALGHCFDASQRCDWSRDCPDGSDEEDCGQYPERCDFESGPCGWTVDTVEGTSRWKIRSSDTLSEGLGPDFDHTFGNKSGHYFFLQKDANPQSHAGIRSVTFQKTTTQLCRIRFWNIISDGAKLEVFVAPKTVSARDHSLAELRGSEDVSSWQKVDIALSSPSEFEVVLRGWPTTDIAVDDVSFTPECAISSSSVVPTVQPGSKCDTDEEFTCRDNSCIPKDMVCDFKTDCPGGFDEVGCPNACSFEDDDECGWYSPSLPQGVTWRAMSVAQAKQQKTGVPPTDALKNAAGSYLLFLASPLAAEIVNPARRFSPVFRQATPDCKISFYHWTYLPLITPRLTITTNGTEDVVLWEGEAARQLPKSWKAVTVGVGRRREPFRLAFEVTTPSSGGPLFAVDELKFVDCAYPKQLPPDRTCEGTQFRCETRRVCVNASKRCDLYDDCGDGSDEKGCSNVQVTFDDGSTGQLRLGKRKSEETEGVLKFQRGASPGRRKSGTGPPFDHTTANATGAYLEYGGELEGYNKMATLVSPVVAGGVPCVVTFHAYMFGRNVLMLSLHRTFSKDDDEGEELWSQKGPQGDFWVRWSVDVTHGRNSQLVFAVRSGTGPSDVIALDDVSFSDSCTFSGQDFPDTEPSTPSPVTGSPHSCDADQFACVSDGTCLPLDRVCDFRNDCADASDESGCVRARCAFQDGELCGWKAAPNASLIRPSIPGPRLEAYGLSNDYIWRIVQAKDAVTKQNGELQPEHDHATGSKDGWYATANSAFGTAGAATLLYTDKRVSRLSGDCYLEAWFYCSSLCLMELLAYDYAEDSLVPLNERYIWISRATSRKQWTPMRAYLGLARDLRLAFRAERRSLPHVVQSLDDLSFQSCSPPARMMPGSSCNQDQFKCTIDNWCIPRSKLCDQQYDCSDKSDESESACSALRSRCTFEEPHCDDWTQDPSSTLPAWSLSRAKFNGYGHPAVDHTLRTRDGSYLSAYRTWGTSSKEKRYGRLVSYVIQADPKLSCQVRFWYNVPSDGITLNVYRRTTYEDGGTSHVRQLPTAAVDFWERAEVDFGVQDRDFEVVIEVVFEGFVNFTGAALDDITMTDGCRKSNAELPGKSAAVVTASPTLCEPEKLPCNDGTCYLPSQRCDFFVDCQDGTDENDCGTTCDFEVGLCGWFNSPSVEGTWVRTQSAVYGDHTYGNGTGHFLKPADTGPKLEGARVQLHSKLYRESGPECTFTFWMYTPAPYLAAMNVHVKHSSTQNKVETLFSKTKGFVHQRWGQESVRIGRRTEFGLIVEGIWGYAGHATTYLDDFVFQKCTPDHHVSSCASSEWMCADRDKCVAVYERCDGKRDCTDGSDEMQCVSGYGDCNFDMEDWTTACNWTVDTFDGKPSWTRAKESHSEDTGPPSSHRGRPGTFFLVANSSWLPEGSPAVARSPVFPASHNKCHLRFWYYMKGSLSMGYLRVQTDSSGASLPMWQDMGNRGARWLYGHAVVGHSGPFNVVFEAHRGGDALTDIAIDDVSFTSSCSEGGDAVQPTGHPSLCAEEEFLCKDKSMCVPRDFVCDCQTDCPDGSDETDCGAVCVTTASPGPGKSTGRAVSTPSSLSLTTTFPCPKGFVSCMDGEHCIPALLLCDGVRDCPDGADERCGDVQMCPVGYYFCSDPSINPCLHRSKVCNGHSDCSDGSDESLCGECPDYFCRNGGNCSIFRGREPQCVCPGDLFGNRCSRRLAQPDSIVNDSSAVSGWSYGAPIFILGILAVVIGVVIFLRKKRARDEDEVISVLNPSYGLPMDDLELTSPDASDVTFVHDGVSSSGIVNLGYQNTESQS